MPTTSTPFSAIYDCFLSKITDDMYMELTQEETASMLNELLQGAIPWFEFPRVNLLAQTADGFAAELSQEEINILAIYMIVEWMGQ
jgi:hypothetical protein